MSLTSAINIGRSGLAASQIGIQVAGNNMANAATPGYSRQIARFLPLGGGGRWPGSAVGAGVGVGAIDRQVDLSLQARLWSSMSDHGAADAMAGTLSQVESLLGELSDSDLSSELSAFFRSWSERANQTRSSAAVVQQGAKLAGFLRRMRNDLTGQRLQADRQMGALVQRADQLLGEVARLNGEISKAEVAGQTSNALRDQRDQLVAELSEYMDVSVVDRGREGADVLVGSTPVVLGSQSRGLALKRTTNASGDVTVSVETGSGDQLTVSSGRVGALLDGRTTAIDATMDRLDQLTGQLIWEVNRLHSTGATTTGLTRTNGDVAFSIANRASALNDSANSAISGLPFRPIDGGFLVRVVHAATGAVSTVRVDVDLDGVDSAGAASPSDDTSAQDIVDGIDAIDGVSAGFNAEGQLEVTADQGFTFTFGDDTSGVLAAAGLNSFFTGSSAGDIDVRSELMDDPNLLATGRYVDGALVENANAVQLAQVQDKSLDALRGNTLAGLWRDTVQFVGGQVSAALSAADAAALVRSSLENQLAAISGVSIDEESINLLQYQRQYQASARVISVADDLTRELIDLV